MVGNGRCRLSPLPGPMGNLGWEEVSGSRGGGISQFGSVLGSKNSPVSILRCGGEGVILA